jgi:FkbM family methyltransferase
VLVIGEGTVSRYSLEASLDALLAEDPRAAQSREESAFEEAAGPFSSALVLFGAGNLGRRTLDGLRRIGIEPLAFSDNNAHLWGRTVDGLLVLSPVDAARRFGASAVFVVTIWRGEGTDRMEARCSALADLGCRRVVPFGLLYWKFPAAFLPHYAVDLPHRVLKQKDAVREAFGLFVDVASGAEFVAQVRWRLHLDFAALSNPVDHEIYFPDDLFRIGANESFVDCGAFDGDTLRRFLVHCDGSFVRIDAFEADPGNFRRLKQWTDGLPEECRGRIHTHPEAVSSERGSVRFNALGNEASGVSEEGLLVDAVALDEVLADVDPSYIKMDIEGAEPEALRGCRNTISRARPSLAVCSYHRQDHLWRLPLAIAGAGGPSYRFFLRPQLLEVWDLVCYAVPEDRLRS